MQFVPAKGPPSGRGWRVLILLFASLLTLGVFTPITASAAYPAQLTVKDKVVVEGDSGTTTAAVKIVLSKRVWHKKVSVGYSTKDGTAKAGSDYVAKSGRVYFAKGARVAKVYVQVIGDKTDEADEYFKVRIFDAHRAVIADRVGKVWIQDNDPAPPPPEKPKLIVRDVTVNEAAGTADFQIVVLSKTALAHPVIFDYDTVDAKAKAGQDYVAKSADNVAVGLSGTTISVRLINDAIDEPDEDFLLRASDVRFADVLKAQGHAVILDNDAPAVLSIGNDPSAPEGDYAHFIVTLTPQSGKVVTVAYEAVGGGAAGGTKGVDFAPTSGTLTFLPGQTTKHIDVKVLEDKTSEPAEQFYVRLSNEVNATVATGHRTGIATIPANSK